MRILGIIPARYASTRFPAKALADIKGRSMVQRVYEQAKKADCLADVIVATDDQRIMEHVTAFGGKAVMTSPEHKSGTDRCSEVVEGLQEHFDFIINIQGDEPFIHPQQIALLSSILNVEIQLATLIKPIVDQATLFDPNTPKVLVDTNQEAIYFSRNTIPYLRGHAKEQWLQNHTFYKHIGIYAYRRDVLRSITRLAPSSLELAESLEQLRWLENGYRIRTTITTHESYGIDTPEDLERVLRLIEE